MKKFLETKKSQMDKIVEQVREKIEQRETVYDERSDDWRESEKGEFYQDQTSELEQICDDLENANDDLESYIHNL